MFHEVSLRLSAWLEDAVRTGADNLLRLEREVARLRTDLEVCERDRAARLEVIQGFGRDLEEARGALRAQTERSAALLAELERARSWSEELSAELDRCRSELDRHRSELDRLGAGLDESARHARDLEASLTSEREERDSWLRVLPGVRIHPPGGRAMAARMRRLRDRLLGRR